MKVIKPLTLGILHKPFQLQRQNHLCVLALGFFKLSEGKKEQPAHRFLIESQAYPKVLPQLPEGQPLDMVMPKGQSEFLLCGHAYSPDKKAVSELNAGVQVGDVSKVLRVIGDREWYYGELSAFKISAPRPFTKMPVGYERAFGGGDYSCNKAGQGYHPNKLAFLYGQRSAAMPNLEYPQMPVKGHRKEYMPASFGPMDIMWKQRFKWVGTYDQHWIENNFPNLAEDADMRLHNQAAEDQRTAKPWVGGEPYQLRCLHPQHPEICGHLPSFRVRGILQTQVGNHQPVHQNLKFNADTVWFFPDSDLGVMLYRAVVPVSTADATDAKALLIAYEHLAESPRPESHYIEQMSARMDRDKVAGQVLNEAALIPTQPESVHQARAKRKQDREEAVKAKTDRIIAELEKDLDVPEAQAKAPEQKDMEGIPKVELPKIEMPEALSNPLSLEDIADGGVDLSAALNSIDEQKAALEAKREEEMSRLEATLNKELSEAIGQNSNKKGSNGNNSHQKNSEKSNESSISWEDLLTRVNHLPLDLHPNTGSRSPDVEQLIGFLESTVTDNNKSNSNENSDSKSKEDKEQLDKLEPMQRAAKRVQTTVNKEREVLPRAMSIKLGEWLLEQLLNNLAGKELSMAGRDLADLCAPGINLSGLDLREVNFEGADLSRANFEKANLFGANFLAAKLDGANFSGANLEEANFSHSLSLGACFNQAQLTKTLLVEANLTQASFLNANLTKAVFTKAELAGADFSRAKLMQTLMSEIKAEGSIWVAAEMTQTVLPKAVLTKADFAEAVMERTIFSGVQASFSKWQECRAVRCFFGGESSLDHSQWQGAVLKTCGFRGVNFKVAQARKAAFFQCDFGNADMTDSDLFSAVLCRSLFSEATLEHVDLRQADMHQAICRGTDFTEADLSESSLVLADMSHAVLLNTKLHDVVERV